MKDAPPPLLDRVRRKLRSFTMGSELSAYLGTMSPDNPLRGLPTQIVGDTSANPEEYFTHYDAFGYWAAAKLAHANRRRRILDVGSPKTQNAILSASHDVTAVVLADCYDRFSAVKYVLHDVTQSLPFPPGSFDCFTSTVALPLIGLGRYGDRVDANCLPNLVSELGRVMSEDADLLVSMTLGPNLLAFNNGWFLDLETIQRVFKGWRLVDVVVDSWRSSQEARKSDASRRFVEPAQLPAITMGKYRVAFCAFVRDSPSVRSG